MFVTRRQNSGVDSVAKELSTAMGSSLPRTVRAKSFLLGLTLALFALSGQAATYYYDNNSGTAGFGTAGNNWAKPTPGPTPGWSTDGTGGTVPGSVTTATGDALNFGNGGTGLAGGTITISGTVDAGDLTFASGSGAIILQTGRINLAPAVTITLNNAADTISGVLAGAATSLTKQGTGTLTVSYNGNEFTGSTIISNGKVALGAQYALWRSAYDTTGSTGAIGLDSTGQATPWLGGLAGGVDLATGITGYGSVTALTLNPQTGASVSYSGVIANGSGNMVLNKTGHGTQTLTGVNSYSGATTVWAGTLGLGGASGSALNSTFTVRGGTLSLDNSAGWANRIADATALSLGSLTLTSFNGAGINAETNGATTFAVGGKITINDGTTGGDQTTLVLGAVTRSVGAAIDFVGANGTLGGGANSPNVTSSGSWPGSVNGILPWATVGGTQWAEDNANSIRAYTGSFFALSSATASQNAQLTGSLALGAAAVGNSLNLITSGAGQSLNLGANNLTLGSAAGSPAAILKSGADAYSISGTGQVRAGSGGAGTELIAHVDGGALTISAPLNNAILGIAKGGTGDLIISGTHAGNMSAATSIAGGTLEFQGAGFTLNGLVAGAGGLTVNLNPGQTFILGDNNNSYAGQTIVKGGYLTHTAWYDVGLPGGLNSLPGTSTSLASSNLKLDGGIFYAKYVVNRNLGDGPGEVQIVGGTAGYVNSAWSGGAVSFVLDKGREIVWGSTYFNPSVFVHSTVGNLTCNLANGIDLNGSTRTILVGDATYNANAGGGKSQLSGVIRSSSGTAGLIKTGIGALVLSGVNTYNGGTTLNAGILQLGGGGDVVGQGSYALGSGTLTIAGNASVCTGHGNNPTLANNVVVNSGVTANMNCGGFDQTTFYYNMTFTGVLSGDGTIIYSNGGGGRGGDLKFTSASNTFTGTLRYTTTNPSDGSGLTVNSLADSANPIQLSGSTTEPADFILGSGPASPLLFNSRQIELNGTGAGGGGIKNNNATATNTITINTDLLISATGNKTLTLGGSNTSSNLFAGAITNGTSAVISLAKEDGGKWILTANSSYSGATTLSGGTLVWVMGGSCSNSAVTVSAGTLSVLVTNSTQQWACSSLSYSAAAALAFDFGATVPSATVAPIQVNGNVSISVAPTVSCTGSGLTGLPPGFYPLIQWTGTGSGVGPGTVTLQSGSGVLLYDLPNKTLWLRITGSTQPLTWQGGGDSIWVANEAVYTKWQDATPVNTNYQEYIVSGSPVGDSVVFTNIGVGTVTVNTVVYPANVLVTGTTNRTFSGSGGIGGGVSLTKAGANTLILASSNTFVGLTAINVGALQLAHTNAIRSSARLNMASVSTLQLRSDTSATFNGPAAELPATSGGNATINVDNNGSGTGNTLTLGGGLNRRNNINNAFTLNVTGGNSYSLNLPTINITGGNDLNLNPTTASLSVGTITATTGATSYSAGNNIALTLGGGAGTVNSINSIMETSNAGTQLIITKNTAATWTLGDVNVKAGNNHTVSAGILKLAGTFEWTNNNTDRNIAVSGTGQLHYNNAGALSTVLGRLRMLAGGSLDNSSGAAITTSTHNPNMDWEGDWTFIGSNGADSDLYMGSGNVNVGAVRTVTIQNAEATFTVGGVITNTGGIIKAGPGTLKLTRANTYSGATIVTNGTLMGAVGGSCANSAVTVSPASGASTLAVSVTNNTMQWTCASLTTAGAGTPNITIGFVTTVALSTNVAPLNIAGAATFTVTPTVTIPDGINFVSGTAYPLMTWGSVSGTPPGTPNLILPGDLVGILTIVGNTLYFTVSSSYGYTLFETE